MPVFLFVPLPPFFYAAIAKRWKVQLSNGLRKINLTSLIQKRHILTRTTMLYNEINSGQLWKKKKNIYMCAEIFRKVKGSYYDEKKVNLVIQKSQ